MTEATAAETIRRPLWEGVQPVAALWFAHAHLGEGERIARLVAAWASDARALRFPEGDILYFASPVLRRCADCTGLPLCRVRANAVASAPLTTAELQQLDGMDIGIVTAARLSVLRLADGTAIDLAPHIDLDAYALHDTFDCREALPPPAFEGLAGKLVRDVVGDKVPPPSPQRDALMRALATSGDGKGKGKRRGYGNGMRTWLDALRGLFVSAAPSPGGIPARQRAPARQRWRAWLAQLAMFTRISRLIGRQHAEQLARLLRMFDDGSIDEALRHAIPLDDDGKDGSLGAAFGGLARRTELTLSTQRAAAAGIGVGDALMDHLRQRYRRAFEKLEREGRIDEAVFVLAELLNARQEALDYLARHGRYAQAAELALGWDMPAPAIIRLLLLAGDTTRALQVARRDNAFATAIAQLEPKHAALAQMLRREWGVSLAARGEWLLAVDAVWPVPGARALAAEWLLAAEAAGTQLSARALVRRAVLLPDTLTQYAERIAALADPDGPADAREALATALIEQRTRSPALRTLARAVLPMVAADRAAGANALKRDQLDGLLSLAEDAALKADLPAWKLPALAASERLAERKEPLQLPLPPAGLHAIYDAVPLPDDRWLVALGESGVAIVDAGGRLRQRYATPATQLVIAQSRRVALALAPRGHVSQVTRIDLVRHAMTDLGTLPLRFHADSFDGLAWTVASENEIRVIDTTSASCDVLWRVGDLPGRIVSARIRAESETYCIETPAGIERWRYQVPGRRLLERGLSTLQLMEVYSIDDAGEAVRLDITQARGGTVALSMEWRGNKHPIDMGVVSEIRIFSHECLDTMLWLTIERGSFHDLHLINLHDGRTVATAEWPTRPSSFVRQVGNRVLCFNEQGRLLDIDLDTSRTRAISIG